MTIPNKIEIKVISMEEAALSSISKDTSIEFGKFGFDACILGAAAFLILADYFLLHIKGNLVC